MTNAADTLYQANFLLEDVGKRQASSKKRVTWIFGTHASAASSVEHEYTVTLVWSKRSGKRFVYMAGSEVFFEGKKTGVFSHKWTTKDHGHLKLHILATAATPSKKYVADDFIKYELIIDGQRFARLSAKDGTPAPKEQTPQRHNKVPSSIFDIIYPNGHHDEKSTKGEAGYKSHAKLSHEVKQRVLKQSKYNAQADADDADAQQASI
jgi:hypothetical protein